MKNTLGKIFALLLFSTLLFAGVKVSVSPDVIYSGDNVHYTISLEGKNPKFPNLNKVAGYGIVGISTSNSINIINGNYKSTVSKTYIFAPKKSIVIPSYEVEVDGQKYKTKTLNVTVAKPTASKSGDEFSISMNMDKNDVYVGEPIKLDVNFKYKLSSKADKIMISPLKIDNFWIKGDKKPVKTMQNDTVVQTYHYVIFPQKSGDFTIKPTQVNIGLFNRRNMGGNLFQDPFIDALDQTLEWKKYISNKLFVHVKPLPNNLEVYGKFNIKASVDKTTVKANKPVNLTIKIKGIGNIDDVKKFSLDFDNVVAYSDEPVIKTGLNSGVYGGVFTQKIALIADSDFTIPSLKFSYFDKDLKKMVTKRTKPIFIKVTGTKKQVIVPKIEIGRGIKTTNSPNTKTVVKEVKVSHEKGFLYLFVGFLFGILVSIGYVKFSKRKNVKEETPIIKKIKKSKNDKELFETLLPYGKKYKFIKDKLEILEANIYGNSKNTIDKKEIIQFFLDNE